MAFPVHKIISILSSFYGMCNLCFEFDKIYKNMINIFWFYFILSSIIRWHPWTEKPYSLISSPIFQ